MVDDYVLNFVGVFVDYVEFYVVQQFFDWVFVDVVVVVVNLNCFVGGVEGYF